MNNGKKLLSVLAVLLMVGSALVCLGTPVSTGDSNDAPLVSSTETVYLNGNADLTTEFYGGDKKTTNSEELKKLGVQDPTEEIWSKAAEDNWYTFTMSGINFETTAKNCIQLTNSSITIKVVGTNTLKLNQGDFVGDDNIKRRVLNVYNSSGSPNLNLIIKGSGSDKSILNIINNSGGTGHGIYVEGAITVSGVSLNVNYSDVEKEITTTSMSKDSGAYCTGLYACKDTIFGDEVNTKTNINIVMGKIMTVSKTKLGTYTSYSVRSAAVHINGSTTTETKFYGNTNFYATAGDVTGTVSYQHDTVTLMSVGIVIYGNNIATGTVVDNTPYFVVTGGNVDYKKTIESDVNIISESIGLQATDGLNVSNGIRTIAKGGNVHGYQYKIGGLSGQPYVSSIGIEVSDDPTVLTNCSVTAISSDAVNDYLKNATDTIYERSAAFVAEASITQYDTTLVLQTGSCKHSVAYGLEVRNHKTLALGEYNVGSRLNYVLAYVANGSDKNPSVGIYAKTLTINEGTAYWAELSADKPIVVDNMDYFKAYLTQVKQAGNFVKYKDFRGDLQEMELGHEDRALQSNYIRTTLKPAPGNVSYMAVVDEYGVVEMFTGDENGLPMEKCKTPSSYPTVIPEGKMFKGWRVSDDYGNYKIIEKTNTRIFDSTTNGESELNTNGGIYVTPEFWSDDVHPSVALPWALIAIAVAIPAAAFGYLAFMRKR